MFSPSEVKYQRGRRKQPQPPAQIVLQDHKGRGTPRRPVIGAFKRPDKATRTKLGLSVNSPIVLCSPAPPPPPSTRSLSSGLRVCVNRSPFQVQHLEWAATAGRNAPHQGDRTAAANPPTPPHQLILQVHHIRLGQHNTAVSEGAHAGTRLLSDQTIFTRERNRRRVSFLRRRSAEENLSSGLGFVERILHG